MLNKIFEKSEIGEEFTQNEIIELLDIENKSKDFYTLLEQSNHMMEKNSGKKGLVFAQIGLNSAPCSGNCKFCSMAADSFCVEEETKKPLEEIVLQARELSSEGIAALFLMTTADYDFEEYLRVARAVKAVLPAGTNMVANIGDFDAEKAKKLKQAGFYGFYHIVRLREGIDTDLDKSVRIATIDNAVAAGLELYYCVEPIGTEHTSEELAQEIMRARHYNVKYMAVMRRVNVAGGKYDGVPQVSDLQMIKIAAATRLAVNPKYSMNLHETIKSSLIAGVNQLYAEYGINPRDNKTETQGNRGLTVAEAQEMLAQYGLHT